MTAFLRHAKRLIGPALFLAIVYFTDLSKVDEFWHRGTPWLLITAAALNVVIIGVKGWRWRELMRMQEIPYELAPAVRHYAVGSAIAAWTPGRIGDFTKAVAVHRERHVGLGRAASSVIADRLMDAVAMGAAAAAGAALLPGIYGTWGRILAAVAAIGVVVAGWLVFRRSPTGEAYLKAGKMMQRYPVLREGVGETLDGLAELKRPSLAVPIVATCAATAVTFLQGFLVARSLSLGVGFWAVSSAMAAGSIASLLPVSVAGLGTREATLALFLGTRNIAMAQILGFSVAVMFVTNGGTALLGALAWTLKPPVTAAPVP